MNYRKASLSLEQQHEAVGRFLSQEQQSSIASHFSVSQSTISRMSQKYTDDPKLKARALAAASLFYELNPDKRPNRARASTHPATASRNCGGLTVMRAIPLPPQAPPQQFHALTSSVTVHPEILRGMSGMLPVEANGPGEIRWFLPGQAFTAGQALGYVQAGQSTPRSCTSQGPLEIHRPAAGAAQPPAGAAQPPAGACSVEEPRPPTCAPAGDLMSFTEYVGNLRPIATPAQLLTFARRQHSEFARCR